MPWRRPLPMRSLSVARHPPPWVRRALPLLVTAVIGAMSEAQEVESLSFLRVPMPSRQAYK